MAVPVVLSLRPEDVVPADLGYELGPGHANNPFLTTPGWVLERWVAAWLASGAPDALTAVLSHITTADIRAVLRIWRTLHQLEEFWAELSNMQQTWSAENYRRQVASLHMRILFIVLVHRLFRVDILHADSATASYSLPRFVDPNYQIHEELQNSRRLHPWLRPAFVLHPQWVGRRSNWSMMALHTLMCTVHRLSVWDAHRTWIVTAEGLHRAGVAHQALYTRVPFGHDFAAPASLSQKGLYVDPTVALLLPRAATELTSLVRKKPLWNRYVRKRLPHLFQPVVQAGGIAHLCQWRPWRLLDAAWENQGVQVEPLFSPSARKSKQSSALMHVREVMFEAYNRWFSKDFVPAIHRECHIYDAAFVPLENFLMTLFDGVVNDGRFDEDRATQIEAHVAAFYQHAKDQDYSIPELTESRRKSNLYFVNFFQSPVLPMDVK